MKRIILSLILAYLLGSISPSGILSKIKKANLRENGSKNLGASNTLLVLGKKWGALVMLLDIAKSYLAVKIAQILVPASAAVAMASGFCAVVGHCFPFYMKFKGGKGLAAFGGVVLAFNPALFAFLLSSATVLVILVNHSFIMPFYASVTFPIYVAYRVEGTLPLLFALAASLLILCTHYNNFQKARRGEDLNIREYIREKLFS